MDELAWAEPDLCQNCAFFGFKNSRCVCKHPEINRPLESVVQCEGRLFLRTKPWHLKPR